MIPLRSNYPNPCGNPESIQGESAANNNQPGYRRTKSWHIHVLVDSITLAEGQSNSL